MTLALVIARAGTAGVSRDDLRKLTQLTPDTLEDLLAALMSAGQVVAVKVGGRLVYRAADLGMQSSVPQPKFHA